ncbi:hypothetical protein [Polyangium jinanense]|uniref:Lipoprotein n=1 Tax=Polyangium jinanense TaxID=2829994 RepID=A0A9X3XBM5_9BACT|nr:hypothetical protein [Polyangium jinanense]MDC3959839.1 hypothetical protein [Polyangium jinanense]MDC3986290.1 hypothetical protein [Polyangium jinanense]
MKRFGLLTATLLASVAATGCVNPYAGLFDPAAMQAQQAQAMADAQAQNDAQILAQLEESRAAVKASPGDMNAARVLAQRVGACFILGLVDRKKIDGEAAIVEADAALEEATKKNPDQKAEALSSKGILRIHAKRNAESIEILEASMTARPTVLACVPLIKELDDAGRSEEVLGHCKKARPAVRDDEDRYTLLDSCLQHSHGAPAEKGLAWAGQADIDFYNQKTSEFVQQKAAYRAEQEAHSAQMRADFDASRRRADEERAARAGASSSGGGGSTYSLRLHNSCSRSVKLFFGDNPKFGSGTRTSLGSNSTTSYSGAGPKTVWIVDDRDQGISSFVASGSQSMQITSSCAGFSTY